MARPLFSHPMVFKEPSDVRNAVYRWASSPLTIDAATLPMGTIGRNAISLALTTTLYFNIRDMTGFNYENALAAVRGGGGQGQSDLFVIADPQTIARFRVIDTPTRVGTGYAFPVTLVAAQGTDPPAGRVSLVLLSYVAIS